MPGSPAFRELHARGELARRALMARDLMTACILCGRRCRANRLVSAKGTACRTGEVARVAFWGVAHGDEPPVRGSRGSGAIQFAGCNLRCVSCGVDDVSHGIAGHAAPAEDIATAMLELEARGCHNINLVNPSHVVAQILESLVLAAERGLSIPVVFNSGGYDSLEALLLLDAVVDVYVVQMKFGESGDALRFARVRNYAPVNRAVVREMHRQVGDLVLDDEGAVARGLIVRHAVLPGGVARTDRVMRFLSEEISERTHVSLYEDYHPCFLAQGHPPLDRDLRPEERREASAIVRRRGLQLLEQAPSGFVPLAALQSPR